MTTASDVYGFGVVVLEIITGQESIDHTRKEESNLVEWVSSSLVVIGAVKCGLLQLNELFRDYLSFLKSDASTIFMSLIYSQFVV